MSWTAEIEKEEEEEGEEELACSSSLLLLLLLLPLLPSRKSTAMAPRVSGSMPRTMSATTEGGGGTASASEGGEGTVATEASSIPRAFFFAATAQLPFCSPVVPLLLSRWCCYLTDLLLLASRKPGRGLCFFF